MQTATRFGSASQIPAVAGIGLRTQHFRSVLGTLPDVGWLEVHSENFFGDGGQPLYYLERIRNHYPISLHGVGLSLGSVGGPDPEHLRRLKALAERIEPGLISEHLSWSAVGGRHLNDLLPLPGTEEAISVVCRSVERTQEVLGRQILVENISSYLGYAHTTIPEPEFIREVIARTGCGLLLDVNNVFVSAHNLGFDPHAYLNAIPYEAVQEIHLAGHSRMDNLLVDTHGTRVADPVWELFADTIARCSTKPTLIEWDNDIPPLAILLEEANKAAAILEHGHAQPA